MITKKVGVGDRATHSLPGGLRPDKSKHVPIQSFFIKKDKGIKTIGAEEKAKKQHNEAQTDKGMFGWMVGQRIA